MAVTSPTRPPPVLSSTRLCGGRVPGDLSCGPAAAARVRRQTPGKAAPCSRVVGRSARTAAHHPLSRASPSPVTGPESPRGGGLGTRSGGRGGQWSPPDFGSQGVGPISGGRDPLNFLQMEAWCLVWLLSWDLHPGHSWPELSHAATCGDVPAGAGRRHTQHGLDRSGGTSSLQRSHDGWGAHRVVPYVHTTPNASPLLEHRLCSRKFSASVGTASPSCLMHDGPQTLNPSLSSHIRGLTSIFNHSRSVLLSDANLKIIVNEKLSI